jgi:hypothetical protein
MTLLSEARNPLSLGEKKITKYGVIYAIWLNDYYRLSNNILYPGKKVITIFRVGDHKFVQGKG